jgi:hypothetical protein
MRDEVIDHSARTLDRRAAHHGRMTACVARVVFIVYLRGRFHPRLLVCVCVCVCARACVCVCVSGFRFVCNLRFAHTLPPHAVRARAQTHKQRFKHGQPVLLVAGE